jgi:hypothetical protein
MWLGVNQGTIENIEEYWSKKVEKMKKVETKWNFRKLTYTGKVHLIRSVFLSIVQFAWDVKTMPDRFITEVEREMWAFIWDDKPERVKRETCRRNKIDGGLSVPDVRKLIQVSRIKLLSRLLEQGDEKWKILPAFFMGLYNKTDTQIMKALTCKEYILGIRKCPTVYIECLKAWSTFPDDCKFPREKVNTILNYFHGTNQEVGANDDVPDEGNQYGLFVKIKQVWKDILSTKRKHLYELLNSTKKKSAGEIYWEKKYENIDWQQLYVMLECQVLDRKVLDFQWKCLNGAIMTEQRLKTFNYSDGICKVCGAEDETLSHILLECDSQGDFWKEVIRSVKENVDGYSFKEFDVMLINQESEVVNWFFMNAKWILWKRRCIIKFDNVWINEATLIRWFNKFVEERVKIGKQSSNWKKAKFFTNISM